MLSYLKNFAWAKVLGVVILTLSSPLAFAEFDGTATLPNGVEIPFTKVAATNWVNGELVLKFTNTVSSVKKSFTIDGLANADFLVIGGGGAGGSGLNTGAVAVKNNKGVGGGGGAGAFVESNDVALVKGEYSITVGAGGLPGADESAAPGGNGSSSASAGNGEAYAETI